MPDIKTEEGKSAPPDMQNEESKSNPADIKSEESKDDPPALSALPNSSTPYLFLGQVIDTNDDKDKDNMDDSKWDDSLSPKQRLRFCLKKVLECNVPEALSITAQHKTIVRPILLKTYWVKGELTGFRKFKNGNLKVTGFKFAKGKLVTSQLKWDEHPEHYTAVAHYLFTPKENGEKTCTECMNPEKYGPFAECVAGGSGFEGDQKKAQYPGSRVPFSAETIRDMPTEVLEKALAIVEAELRRRREIQVMGSIKRY
ncbi:hypothetical protein N0V85_005435 [Neurospora sp. IMI 360204]|nr:hypothetical protein N0V85_005435 [Neurospora sp. IMI 360204]